MAPTPTPPRSIHTTDSGRLQRRQPKLIKRCAVVVLVLLVLFRSILWTAKGPIKLEAAATSTSTNTKAHSSTGSGDDSRTSAELLAPPTEMPTVSTALPDPYIPPSLPIKTLVVLIGNLRCGELAWASLYRNLVDWNNHHHQNQNSTVSIPHSVHLALAIGNDVESVYKNATLFQRAKHVFSFPEFGEDWSSALDQIDPSWKVKVAPLLSNFSIVLGGVRHRNWHGSGAISFWIRWFLSQKLLEHDSISRYDRFVITRTDHFYMCPLDLSVLDPRYLWVPFGQDFGGITDRHLIVSSRDVLAALNILPGLFQDPSLYPLLGSDQYNPEQLLWDRWKQEGLVGKVRRFPRMMFTCGNPDVDDKTRWKATGDIVMEGVRKKYRKEYIQSEDTCKGGNHY